MARTTENRIRRLERGHRPPPCREESFAHCTESEIIAMRDAARSAVAGDSEAGAELRRLLALTDARKGLMKIAAERSGTWLKLAR